MSNARGQAVSRTAGGQVPPVLSLFLPGPVGPVGTDITSNWFRVPEGGLDLTGAKAHIVMRVAGGTTDPAWDLMRSTNNGTSFTTVLPSGVGNKLIATHAQKVTDLTPAWATTTLNEGDLLRVDVVQTDDGSGGDIEITIVLAQ